MIAMTKQVVIVGAGRQGRNVLEILNFDRMRYPVAGFLDDTKAAGDTVMGVPVLGGFDRMNDGRFVAEYVWFVAVGASTARREIGFQLKSRGATLVNAIHPSTDVSSESHIGTGVFVAAFVRIASLSRIEDLALIESFCVIGCDTAVGSAMSFGPSCVLTGGASVGAATFVGAGTVISNNVHVGSNCVVGANAVVVRDIPDGARAQGVPARVVAPA
jgi:sugar O-acyltransferase (sialic acid O-acetyltransferase NeuD family)